MLEFVNDDIVIIDDKDILHNVVNRSNLAYTQLKSNEEQISTNEQIKDKKKIIERTLQKLEIMDSSVK